MIRELRRGGLECKELMIILTTEFPNSSLSSPCGMIRKRLTPPCEGV